MTASMERPAAAGIVSCPKVTAQMLDTRPEELPPGNPAISEVAPQLPNSCPTVVELLPRGPRPGPTSTQTCRLGPDSDRSERMPVQIGPSFDQIWAIWVNFGKRSTRCNQLALSFPSKPGQTWPNVGRAAPPPGAPAALLPQLQPLLQPAAGRRQGRPCPQARRAARRGPPPR